MTPKAPRRDQVRRLTEKGLTPREIATLLGISTQAVYKHLTALRAKSEEAAAS